MGDKMRQFAEELKNDPLLRMHIAKGLLQDSGSYVPVEIVGCLEDPDQNAGTRTMLERVGRGLEDGSLCFVDRNKLLEVRVSFRAACQKAGIKLDK